MGSRIETGPPSKLATFCQFAVTRVDTIDECPVDSASAVRLGENDFRRHEAHTVPHRHGAV
jgi:hypothetical protein